MPQRTLSGYRLSPQARNDLGNIWSYTAQTWSADQADTYLRGLDQKLGDLCLNPESARERKEIDPPVRLHPYRSHLVIYRIEGDQLAVIRIVHYRQHWQLLLNE